MFIPGHPGRSREKSDELLNIRRCLADTQFMRLCLFLLLILNAWAGPEPAWESPWKTVDQLESILASIPQGQQILEQAKKRDPDFAKKIRKGNTSFTESTFQRSYSLNDGSEQVEKKFRVTLNKSLPLSSATLDFAHELVHFARKEMQDPYHSEFQLKSFVENGIEGSGGELAALQQECLVAWELEARYRSFPVHGLCLPYKGEKGAFLLEKAKRDYYALGHHYYSAPDELKKLFPQISFNGVRFSSSYAKKPYPLALFEEFYQSKEAACANNRKKWELVSAQSTNNRAPASVGLLEVRKKLVDFQKRNCRNLQAPK